MKNDILSGVKGGDEVLIQCCLEDDRLEKVIAVTKTGKIKTSSKLQFFPNGKRVGEPLFCNPVTARLVTEDEKRELKEKLFCEVVRARFNNMGKLSYENAVKVAEIMGWNIEV